MTKNLTNKKGEIIFFLSFVSLLISFFFNEDGTGSGAQGDFEVTFGFIFALQENLLADPVDWTLVHTPLHFIILSFVARIVDDPYILRMLFCIFSISLPILFYLIISLLTEDKTNRTNLLILSACIFFIPSFRYTSIWANDLITSILFFLFSIYYFNKWEKNKKEYLDKNLLLQILFLVLATYTRQYFAVFFIHFLFQYYNYLPLRNFIKLFLICVLSSIPVFIYTYLFPELLTGQLITIKAINYFILGNSSIISLTLYPIILINLFYKNISLRKLITPCILSIIIIFLLQLNFNPYNWQGGGINYIISQKLFENNLYFFFSSFFTIVFFIYLFNENKRNTIILLTILFMFFSMQVYQRYYDPMFFILFFTLIKTDLIKIFFKNINACLLLLFYFFIYYFLSISDLIYRI